MITLDSFSFDTLFPLWQEQLISTGVLSLASVDFVCPDGMILLFLGLVYVLRELPYIVLYVPNVDVRSYLARVGFFNALPQRVTVEPRLTRKELSKSIRFNANCASLLELTIVESINDLPKLLDKIVDAAERFLHYSNELACDVGVLVSEIWQNAIEHGQGNYAAGVMQVYGEGPRRRLELAIGDDGVGIAYSLNQNKKYKNINNDQDAIEKAVLPKVSGLLDSTRGNGLTKVVEKTTEQNGILNIRSGSAKFRFQGERNARFNHHVPNLPGTQVVVSLAAA